MTAAEYLVGALRQLGVTTLFGVHGANIEDVYDAAVRTPGITPVVAKHEFGAGAMADGVARLGVEPGVVVTTSGGGAMNVVPALAESYDSRVPVLAVIGTAPTTMVGRGGFQDMLSPPDTIDLTAVLGGVSGSVSVVGSADELPAALDVAISTLRADLPAVLVIPKDIQKQTMTTQPSAVVGWNVSTVEDTDIEADTDADAVAELAQRITDAIAAGRRICLWVGEEAARRRIGPQVSRLSEIVGATVVASPGGRELCSEQASFAGVTGVMGHPSAHRAIAQAGLCLAIGTRMMATDRGGLDAVLGRSNPDGVEVVHIGSHAPRFGGVDGRVVGDIVRSLELLIKELGDTDLGDTNLGDTPSPSRSSVTVEYLPEGPRRSDTPPTGVPMRVAVEAIGSQLGGVRAVFADAGNAGASAIHYLPFGAQRFVVALGMGGMGYGIAAGVGCAIAETAAPDPQRVVVIAGDGAFLMHGMEIHTAIEHRAPLTLIVLNNNAHGMCVTREQLYFPGTPSVNRFAPADIAGGLTALFPGLDVVHAQHRSEVEQGCAALFAASGTNCLVIDTDPDECPPFAPFLTRGPQ